MGKYLKNMYTIIGVIFIIGSLIIYFTKGEPYYSTQLWGSVIQHEYLLHLFWSLITFLLGILTIFVGVIKQK